MADGVEARLREVPPLTIIDLRGEVTTFAEDTINAAYRDASARGAEHILLNFAGVDYLNSAGIAIVIGILTETRKREQSLLITGLTPHYQKVLSMMGVSQYAPVFPSEDEALASVRGGQSS